MKKSNLIQLTALCFILSLTAACGGKNSSGGNSSSSTYTSISKISSASSNLLAPAIRGTTTGEQVVYYFNQALSFRNSSSENGSILRSGFTRGAVSSSTTTNSNCSTGTFLNFFDYTYCKGNGSSTGSTISFASTPTQFCTILDNNNKLTFASAVSNTIPYNSYGCSLSNRVEYTKAKNTELNKVLSLNNSSWQLYGASASGSVIYLLVGTQNSTPSILYAIDTAYHSIYNPVSIQNVQIVNNTIQTSGNVTKSLILQ